MSKIIINGGHKLKGEIWVEGSKNAVLPILAATVLNGGINIINNCPKINDVYVMLKILKTIGCKVSFEDNCCTVDSSSIQSTEIPDELAAEMRSSIIFMGPVLARGGEVTISYPGGCVTLLTIFWRNDKRYERLCFHFEIKGKKNRYIFCQNHFLNNLQKRYYKEKFNFRKVH